MRKRFAVVVLLGIVLGMATNYRPVHAEEAITEGPVAKEVFGYLWVPDTETEVTESGVYIPDRLWIQRDGKVLRAPFFHPSEKTQAFIGKIVIAIGHAYANKANGDLPKCDGALFDKVMSDWRFDWDDSKALRHLKPCLK